MDSKNFYNLEKLLKENDMVIIDTCAIFNKGFIPLLKENIKRVSQLKKPMILHEAVLAEIMKISQNPRHLKYHEANNIIPVLKMSLEKNIFKIVKNETHIPFADQQFIEYIINSRDEKRIALITLDKNLTSDVLLQNRLVSFRGYEVKVYKISPEGKLYVNSKEKNKNVFSENKIREYKEIFGVDTRVLEPILEI